MKKFARKVLSLFMVLVLSVCAMPLSGIDFEDITTFVKAADSNTDDYEYTAYPHQYGGGYTGGILIERYLGKDEHVVIPSHIDGYAVRIIEGFDYIEPDRYYPDEECYEYSFMKSVVVPETAVVIGSHAFKGATNLESVTLPYGLETIYGQAFDGCTNLKEITIPDTVTYVDFSAFVNSGVEEITLGESITEIDFAELQETNIKRITFKASDLIFENFNVHNSSLEEVVCDGSVYRVRISAFNDVNTENKTDMKFVCNGGIWISAHQQLKKCGFYPQFDSENGSVIYTAYPDENPPVETVSGNYKYYLNDNSEAVISRYLGSESIINVPETLDGHTVTEIGPMAFHGQSNDTPYFENIISDEMITSITLPETVTKIGHAAFSTNSILERINLPSGIDNIPDSAFAYCKALTSIQFPADLKTIGAEAFFLCKELNEIDFPDGLREIENDAFYKCENLTSVTIPGSIKHLGNGIFRECSSLTSAVFADGLTELSYELFYACEALENIVLPETLTKVNPECFALTNLSYVYLPEKVTLIERGAFACGIEKVDFSPLLKRIEKYAFGGASFKSFILPNRLEYIGNRAFEFCDFEGTVSIYGKNLTVEKDAFYASTAQRIEIKDGVSCIEAYAFDECDAFEIIIDEGVEAIGRCAFTNCKNTTEITIPKTISYMGASVFAGSTNIKTINYNAINCKTDGVDKLPFAGLNPTTLNIGNSVESIENSMFKNFELIESVTLPESLESLGTGVFKNCKSLKSLELPDGVKSIGDSTFSGCTALETVTFTDELQSIGKNAFAGCTSLTEITIPAGIRELDLSSFENCTSVKTVYYNATNCRMTGLSESPVEGVYYSPFYTCTAVENIILGDNIMKIPDYLYCGLVSVKSINIPQSVTELGKAAFAFCGFSKLTGGENIKKGGDYCFYSCKNLEGMFVIPPGIKDLGDYVFAESGIEFLTTFATLESIGDYCFLNCEKLKSLNIAEGVMIVGNNAFEGCIALENAIIPESVKNIGEAAFKGCDLLQSVKISSNIVFIPDECFNFCTSLSNVEWNVESKLVGRLAFGNCSALYNFNFIGVEKLYENSFYKSGVGDVTLGEALNSEAAKLEEIEVKSFMDCDNLETLTIGGNVSTVMSLAFADCDNLSMAVISDNVTDIADDAFDGCENLTFVCSTESYAYSYANARGIPVSTFVVESIPNQLYTGYALKPEVEVSMSGNRLSKNIDFTTDYSNNINVGTGMVKINGSGKYKMFSSTATFTILTRHITLAKFANISEQAYTGSAVKPKIILTDNGKVLTEGKDYTVTYNNNVEIGEGVAVAKGIGNYSGYTSVKFVIADQSTSARLASLFSQIFSYITAFFASLFGR